MARVPSINSIGNFSFGNSIYNTKRQNMDNSEIYILSKLSKLYDQAVADCFVNSKLQSIRQFTNKKN